MVEKPSSNGLSKRAVYSLIGGLIGIVIVAIATALVTHEGRISGAEKDIGYAQKTSERIEADLKDVKKDIKDGFSAVQETLTKIQKAMP